MVKRKTAQVVGGDEPLKILRLVSASLLYNSDGRSVAVRTVVTNDGKQHTFKADLDDQAEEILLSEISRLMGVPVH